VCHSGSSLDLFGEAFEAVPGHASDPAGALASLSDLDSDGDGYRNGYELEMGTFPGDPDSFPTAAEGWVIPWADVALVLTPVAITVLLVLMYNRWQRLRPDEPEEAVEERPSPGSADDLEEELRREGGLEPT
jgi:hypothetical protein